jgi:L-aspartate oxidase
VTAGAAPTNGAYPAAHASPRVEHFDFLVLGSGIAGLSYALKVAEHGRVALVTKAGVSEGCTAYAQVGVCGSLADAGAGSDFVGVLLLRVKTLVCCQMCYA